MSDATHEAVQAAQDIDPADAQQIKSGVVDATKLAADAKNTVASVLADVTSLREAHDKNAAILAELAMLPAQVAQLTTLVEDMGPIASDIAPVVERLRGFFAHLFPQDNVNNPPAAGTAATAPPAPPQAAQ